MANRMVDSARSVLNSYLPDVYIYTDMARGGGKDRQGNTVESLPNQVLFILKGVVPCQW